MREQRSTDRHPQPIQPSSKLSRTFSVITELDEADALYEGLTPGGEIVSEEFIVQVIPQGRDEFTCSSCFLVRHRSQLAREAGGHFYCVECEV